MKYEIKSNPTGQYYLPKEVREELGPRLSMICNAKAAIIFCPNEPIEVILESLNIIQLDLKHRMQIQQRKDDNLKNRPTSAESDESRR